MPEQLIRAVDQVDIQCAAPAQSYAFIARQRGSWLLACVAVPTTTIKNASWIAIPFSGVIPTGAKRSGGTRFTSLGNSVRERQGTSASRNVTKVQWRPI